ncbi:carboxylating nicotinate-nucleotide diphosphorylase [Jeotgalibacillus sp. S-D1]|uniref:carboxylating nicotinate-nucleotide diphosphorylase n=1 Tax=Jeotgalibacillus sp. S-D1 TaxID=2552189 RepID=UPI00105A2936|nr:carboxylating nicotinate-nucleotide diphosphorylase [Jeotgalibacillus sp. S-D1]TDL30635.1 carboxylating nicotinate-nucleotide diphosphorylase [Jeotgalibacillus sp. S-D1]
MNMIKARKLLEQFLLEDVQDLDITSQSLFNSSDHGKAEFIVKERGILSGLMLINELYGLIDSAVSVALYKQDGELAEAGERIALITGPVQSLLTGERVVLNLIQRMSGIATLTDQAVKTLNSTHTKICDTRKTTPGLRMFEKYAVRCGGGMNHRFGLYDGVMLKDNHIEYAGSIKNAVERVRSQIGHMVKIEVEIETQEQLHQAIESKADIIMFDNCSPKTIKNWIADVPEGIVTEASGGITLNKLEEYSACGVDYISLGFITHSVKSLDISLDIKLT